MALKTSRRAIYGVMSFSQARGGVAIDGVQPAQGERTALRMAERLAAERVGAVAFYRVGDPEFGEFDEPVIVGEFGSVPYDVREIFSS